MTQETRKVNTIDLPKYPYISPNEAAIVNTSRLSKRFWINSILQYAPIWTSSMVRKESHVKNLVKKRPAHLDLEYIIRT